MTLWRFYFRSCDLTAECRLARANVRAQLPAAAPTSFQAVRQLAQQSLQNSVCSGQHRGGLPNPNSKIKNPFLGPWLKSEAPALQAVPSGSVTRRTPPFHRGKLDQSTEMSLINSFRWVQLPLPLPFSGK